MQSYHILIPVWQGPDGFIMQSSDGLQSEANPNYINKGPRTPGTFWGEGDVYWSYGVDGVKKDLTIGFSDDYHNIMFNWDHPEWVRIDYEPNSYNNVGVKQLKQKFGDDLKGWDNGRR